MYASPSRLLLALLKANSALHASIEGTHDSLKARFDDRAQRRADAAEFAALRLRMRTRYREWLKERNHRVCILGFAHARAHALQAEIGTMLEQRYGIDVKHRFIAAGDDGSTHPNGERSDSQEYAERIKRLHRIILDIRLGRIARRGI